MDFFGRRGKGAVTPKDWKPVCNTLTGTGRCHSRTVDMASVSRASMEGHSLNGAGGSIVRSIVSFQGETTTPVPVWEGQRCTTSPGWAERFCECKGEPLGGWVERVGPTHPISGGSSGSSGQELVEELCLVDLAGAVALTLAVLAADGCNDLLV